MRVIFYLADPEINASSRYRVSMYLPFLKKEGIEYYISTPASDDFFASFLERTNSYLKKFVYYFLYFFRRFKDILKAYKYDVVVIQRQIFPYGPPLLEKLLIILNKNIIFDTDDANFVKPAFATKNIFQRFNSPNKIINLIKISKQVTVADDYIKTFAIKYNSNVTIIPMCIDLEHYIKEYKNQNKFKKENKPVVGWIGTKGGLIYLKSIKNVFPKLKQSHDFTLKIISYAADSIVAEIGSDSYDIEKKFWNLNEEISDLYTLDIGIVPLVKEEFEKGKFPFKALQYMAVGIPVVGTRWGVLEEIITDGVNGFLVDNEEEWIDKLGVLLKDADLRKKMGENGRKVIKEKFTYDINAPKFIDILKMVSKSTKG